jgi:nucleoside-diphosphate-sugar epimerase
VQDGVDVVTGAFGNAGSAIAARLRTGGRTVRTLTNHAPSDPHGIDVWPLAFDDPEQLAAAFAGATTFYNTYWMRMGDASGYENAVANSRALISAAARAGVQRIVQFSVIKPSLDSPYPYFRAKARVEEVVRGSGVGAAIVRPAVIFGGDDALLNNLAWLMRRMPVFAVPGDGKYRVRPIHIDDVADICIAAAARDTDEVIDAVGPERPTFDELVRSVRSAVHGRARLVHAPARLVLGAARMIGTVLRSDLLTRDELASTMDGLADSDAPATGAISLSSWIADHGDTLGRRRVG